MSKEKGFTALDYADIADNAWIVVTLQDKGARYSGKPLPAARGQANKDRGKASVWVAKDGRKTEMNADRPMAREVWHK